MIERIEFAQYQVDWFRQPEMPHVTADDTKRQPQTSRLLTGQPTHSWGEIHAVHLGALARQHEGRCSCPTCQVTCGFEVQQNLAKHALPGRLVPGQVKCEELVVILR